MVASSDWPLIIFTVMAQLGIGMSLFASGHFGKAANTENDVTAEKSPFSTILDNKRLLWFVIGAITGIAVFISLFHLGQPLMAYLAFSNLGVSWLSMEILVFGIFCILALFTWITGGNAIFALLTSIVGIAAVVVQGYTYAESALPAIDNAFPLVLFMLSTLVMGAAVFGQYRLLSGSLSALLAIVLTVPCVWTSGSPIMQLTAQMWSMSFSYWFGTLLLLIALLLANKQKNPLLLSLIVILAIFSIRITFFAETPYEWMLLGMPN